MLSEGELYGAATTVELLSFSISLEDLKKIANAKKVEVQVGRAEFTIDNSKLESINEFYKQLIP